MAGLRRINIDEVILLNNLFLFANLAKTSALEKADPSRFIMMRGFFIACLNRRHNLGYRYKIKKAQSYEIF